MKETMKTGKTICARITKWIILTCESNFAGNDRKSPDNEETAKILKNGLNMRKNIRESTCDFSYFA